MVTTRRAIEEETDRYGSFSETDREISAEEIIAAERIITPERTVIPEETKVERQLVINPIQPDVKPAVRNTEDMMPSIVKMEVDEPVEYAKEEKLYARRDKKLSASMRNLLIVYMVLIVAVVGGVIATGIASTAMASTIESLEATIAAQEETIVLQESSLSVDEAVIREAASELGMVEIDGVDGSYDLLSRLESEESTNPFDEFRDGVYEIFG